MTELTGEAKVTRKVQAFHRDRTKLRQLIVTLRPMTLEIRLHKTRQAYSISYESVLHAAALIAADKKKAERIALKKANAKKAAK